MTEATVILCASRAQSRLVIRGWRAGPGVDDERFVACILKVGVVCRPGLVADSPKTARHDRWYAVIDDESNLAACFSLLAPRHRLLPQGLLP
jgi:hypothetical protein